MPSAAIACGQAFKEDGPTADRPVQAAVAETSLIGREVDDRYRLLEVSAFRQARRDRFNG
jgi:hypothetical protein